MAQRDARVSMKDVVSVWQYELNLAFVYESLSAEFLAF
jgi:hypothetical protein